MSFIKKITKNISKPLIIAIAIFIIGSTITYYENRINKIEVPKKVNVIVANRDIRIGDIITGEHLKEKIVYTPDKLEGGITNINELIGRVALTTIVKGKEITNKEITTKKAWFSEDEREVGITFKAYTDIVGGDGKTGDIVDFMISYPPVEKNDIKVNEYGKKDVRETIIKEPKEIVSSIEIKEIFNEANMPYTKTKDKDTFKPYTILVRLTTKQEALIDMAKKEGRLYLRRHGNYMRYIDNTRTNEESKVIITGLK